MSQSQDLGMHALPSAHLNWFATHSYSQSCSSDDKVPRATSASMQSFSLSQTHPEAMQRPLAQANVPSGHLVASPVPDFSLQFSSSELSKQSLEPSQTHSDRMQAVV